MYYASLDGENFNIGPAAERHLAYAFGLRELVVVEKGATVWVGERDDFVPKIEIGCVLDQLTDDAIELCGEASDGWPNFTSAQEKGLEEGLNSILHAWLAACGENPEFFGIKNVEKISNPLIKKAKSKT